MTFVCNVYGHREKVCRNGDARNDTSLIFFPFHSAHYSHLNYFNPEDRLKQLVDFEHTIMFHEIIFLCEA